MSSDRRFGVILFDDPTLKGQDEAGWASVSGEKPFRVARVSDLASDIIWLCDAEYNAARAAGHQSLHNVRGGSFLGTAFKSIISDLTGANEPTNPVACQYLSVLAQRIGTFALQHYGERALGGYSLSVGMQSVFDEGRVPTTGEGWVDLALTSAYQQSAKCDLGGMPFLANAKTVHVRDNRFLHALQVMESLTPAGSFEYISGTKIPMSADFILNGERPALVQVSVSKIDPDIAGILGFGASSGKRTKVRDWVAAPELVLLDQFAQVKIKGAIFWERAEPLKPHLQIPDGMRDGMLAMSYSAGVIAEAHLKALMAGKKDQLMNDQRYTPRAVFLAAVDRVLTFPLVRALREAGFPVMSYGLGAVAVRAKASMLKDLSDFVRDAGLSFPLPEVAEKGFVDAAHVVQ